MVLDKFPRSTAWDKPTNEMKYQTTAIVLETKAKNYQKIHTVQNRDGKKLELNNRIEYFAWDQKEQKNKGQHIAYYIEKSLADYKLTWEPLSLWFRCANNICLVYVLDIYEWETNQIESKEYQTRANPKNTDVYKNHRYFCINLLRWPKRMVNGWLGHIRIATNSLKCKATCVYAGLIGALPCLDMCRTM